MPNPVVDADGVVHVSNSNVDFTGATDSTAALQACFDVLANNPRASTIEFPSSGRIRLDNVVGWNQNRPITVRGKGNRHSLVIEQRGPAAFSFWSTVSFDATGMHVSIENLKFEAYGSGGYAIQILQSVGIRIDNVQGIAIKRPDGGYGYWDRFLNINDSRLNKFRDMLVINIHPELAGSSDVNTRNSGVRGNLFHIRTSGSIASTDHHFDTCIGLGFDNYFDAEASGNPGIEGIFFKGCEAVFCNRGIRWVHNNGNGYKPPLCVWNGGHMNIYKQFVDLQNVAQFILKDCSLENITALDPVNGAGNTTPVALSNVDGFNIADVVLFTNRGVSPIAVFPGCDKGVIRGIRGGGSTTAPAVVQILGGSRNITCDDIVVYNTANMVISGVAAPSVYISPSCRQATYS